MPPVFGSRAVRWFTLALGAVAIAGCAVTSEAAIRAAILDSPFTVGREPCRLAARS